MKADSVRYLGLLLLAALLFGVLPAPKPGAAQLSTSPLSSDPAALDLSLALGTSRDLSLTLRNTGSAPFAPRFFEALAAVASPAAIPSGAPAPTRQGEPRIDPQIAQDQAEDPAGESEFLVILSDQADLTAAYALEDWAARGAYVYRTLRDHAAISQAPLQAMLAARGLTYTPFWIVNALAVRGDAADVAALAVASRVAELRATRVAQLTQPPVAPTPIELNCAADARQVCWHLRQVNASRVWSDFGVRGAGITVASIDSGVRFDHPALIAQYRGSGPGGLDHRYNWFDPYGAALAPIDSGNHGTHVMGIMVASGSSVSAPAVGVAPDARWIAARACSSRECSEIQLIQAAQWMLAPTDPAGQNPRPDLRPHVINNSWTAGQDSLWFTGYVAAWRAAGIYPVFAAGNAGNIQGCGTIQSPGDYATVTAVGATDSNDRLASFSSIGPTLDGRLKPDLIAPGSGVVSTVADARIYASNSGTSMASPHLAGAVALLWSANPGLIGNYEATYAALTASAFPIPLDARFLGAGFANCRSDQLPNNLFGYGRLDLYGAVARVSVDVPWLRLAVTSLPALASGASTRLNLTLDAGRVPAPGLYQARVLVHGSDLSQAPLVVPVTLRVLADASYAVVTGQVTRTLDGAPLAATVTVTGGATAQTDAQGRYRLILPPSDQPYQLTAAATGHVSRSASLNLSPGQSTSLDFTLAEDQPRLTFDAMPSTVNLGFAEQRRVPITLANQGTLLLSYSASLLNERYGVWRSDEPAGLPTAWRDPPANAVTLDLAADGASVATPLGFSFTFFDTAYEQISITANGLIVFDQLPQAELAFSPRCLPLDATFAPAIAVLHADLDPTQPGARVSYANLPEGLLVSWEEVPLAVDPALRLSFQALLMRDNRISLHYRAVTGLSPTAWAAVGVQRSLGESQSVSCQGDQPLRDGLGIELRPQPPPSTWASLANPIGSIAPGDQAQLAATVRWVSPLFQRHWPLSAVIELRSNDPQQSVIRLTVRASSAAAPYVLLFPIFN